PVPMAMHPPPVRPILRALRAPGLVAAPALALAARAAVAQAQAQAPAVVLAPVPAAAPAARAQAPVVPVQVVPAVLAQALAANLGSSASDDGRPGLSRPFRVPDPVSEKSADPLMERPP